MMRVALPFLGLFLLLAAPFAAAAHGAGAYFEQTVGAYIADIGFSTPAPEENESVIFDFQLRKTGTSLNSGSDVEFSDVWVRIESSDSTVFAGGIHNAEFGGPRMSYVFPSAGAYTISVRYENGSEVLAEVSFPMTVLPESGTGPLSAIPYADVYGAGIAGLILGAALAFFLKKRPFAKL